MNSNTYLVELLYRASRYCTITKVEVCVSSSCVTRLPNDKQFLAPEVELYACAVFVWSSPCALFYSGFFKVPGSCHNVRCRVSIVNPDVIVQLSKLFFYLTRRVGINMPYHIVWFCTSQAGTYYLLWHYEYFKLSSTIYPKIRRDSNNNNISNMGRFIRARKSSIILNFEFNNINIDNDILKSKATNDLNIFKISVQHPCTLEAGKKHWRFTFNFIGSR